MDVFEQVKREQGRFAPRWAIDHAETVRDEELRRIKALGGGIAIQNRMAFAGEGPVPVGNGEFERERMRYNPHVQGERTRLPDFLFEQPSPLLLSVRTRYDDAPEAIKETRGETSWR